MVARNIPRFVTRFCCYLHASLFLAICLPHQKIRNLGQKNGWHLIFLGWNWRWQGIRIFFLLVFFVEVYLHDEVELIAGHWHDAGLAGERCPGQVLVLSWGKHAGCYLVRVIGVLFPDGAHRGGGVGCCRCCTWWTAFSVMTTSNIIWNESVLRWSFR